MISEGQNGGDCITFSVWKSFQERGTDLSEWSLTKCFGLKIIYEKRNFMPVVLNCLKHNTFLLSFISAPVISKSLILFALVRKRMTLSMFSRFPWFCRKKPRRLCFLNAPLLWKSFTRQQLLVIRAKVDILLGTSTPMSVRPSSNRRTATAGTASRAEDHRKGSAVIRSHRRKSLGLVEIQVCNSDPVIILIDIKTVSLRWWFVREENCDCRLRVRMNNTNLSGPHWQLLLFRLKYLLVMIKVIISLVCAGIHRRLI